MSRFTFIILLCGIIGVLSRRSDSDCECYNWKCNGIYLNYDPISFQTCALQNDAYDTFYGTFTYSCRYCQTCSGSNGTYIL